jgi:hypothetical protein
VVSVLCDKSNHHRIDHINNAFDLCD